MALQKSTMTPEEPAHLYVWDVGDVFIAGPQGSGKTTLLALGIAQFAGLPPDARRAETRPEAGENPKQNSDDATPSLDAINGDPLAGSGFEDEEPDPEFHSGE
jgi:hypothetical protein